MKIQPDTSKQASLCGKEFTVKPEYRHIPEACGLVWKDNFFEEMDEDEIVAVFDFDYSKMKQFMIPKAWLDSFVHGIYWSGILFLCLLSVIEIGLYVLAGIMSLVLLYNITLLSWNITWNVHAHHASITRDGIRFVLDKRKTWFGLSMCDAGRNSKTVPFDKITDCDIEEPAGNAYLCIPRILYTVNIDTASSSGVKHELQLTGLEDPHAFKKLVWAMKRHRTGVSANTNALLTHPELSSSGGAPSVMEMVERGTATAPATVGAAPNSNDVVGLLQSIQQELKINNELLRTQQAKATDAEIV